MSTSALTNLPSDYLQSLLNSSLQNAGSTANNTNDSSASTAASSLAEQSDNGGLSPFAQLMSTLQQLEQSNPTEYAQVTQQIATDLTAAGQTAQSEGNTTAANQLNQLATDFTNASTSGQLPNVQDLAQAVSGGGHHHHHHHGGGSSSSSQSSASSTSAATTTTSNSVSQLNQLLSAFQANGSQSDSLNPMTIIMNALANAGVTSSSE
jgi:aromatic ring hydroxylase